jgi:membrane associated rhomboid family serine protease
MLPLKPRYEVQTSAWSVYLIIALCAVVFLWEQTVSPQTVLAFAYHPFLSIGAVTAMFLHADWLHLVGNMLVLHAFGKPVADKIGNRRFLLIYLAMGVAAALFYGLLDSRPMIGASGAVMGVVAMSLILMPFVDIKTLVWLFPPIIIDVAAFWIAGLWFILDVWGSMGDDGGIAYEAHVGGFLAGLACAYWLLKTRAFRYRGGEQSLFKIFFKLDLDTHELDRPAPAAPTAAAASGTARVAAGRCFACSAPVAPGAHRCLQCGVSLLRPR